MNDNLSMLTESLEKAKQSLDFVVEDLRQALPRCRGPLTTSSLLLMRDLELACALRNNIDQRLSALQNPMEDA
jgi:hypothetical protein